MAKFAPVAPIQLLEQLFDYDPELFGNYHLLLAHHTAEYRERFRSLFNRARQYFGDEHLTVIMDNSVVETGGFVDTDMMQVALEAIDRDGGLKPIAVLPDVMGDGPATLEATVKAIDDWSQWPCELMMVTQGPDMDGFLTNLAYVKREDRIQWIGVPRVLVESLGSRQEATEEAVAVMEECPGKRVHLLGFSDNVWDDQKCAHIQGVFGIDSAVPLRYNNVWTPAVDPGPRGNWFETARLNNFVTSNLHGAREAFRGFHG